MNKYTFYLYILKCSDGSYYVGTTSSLEQRIFEHNQGLGCRYTAERRPLELIWANEFGTKGEALEAERKIKGWSRKKKEALMHGDFVKLKNCAKKKFKKNKTKLKKKKEKQQESPSIRPSVCLRFTAATQDTQEGGGREVLRRKELMGSEESEEILKNIKKKFGFEDLLLEDD